MNKLIFLLATVSSLFFACSKSSKSCTSCSVGSGSTNRLRIQTALAYDPTGYVYDSIIINYTYDNQNRIIKSTQMSWDNDNRSGPLVSEPGLTSSTQYSYADGKTTVATYPAGSSSPSNQVVDYINSSSSQLDSSVSQSYSNNIWMTTERDLYAYGTDGSIKTKTVISYDPQTGQESDSAITYSAWSSGDKQSDSIISVSFNVFSPTTSTTTLNYTYYGVANPVVTDPGADFNGMISSDILKTETLTINGSLFSAFTTSYTLDNSNRFNTISIFLNGATAPYTKDFFIYY